jgi:hypothetical protein
MPYGMEDIVASEFILQGEGQVFYLLSSFFNISLNKSF